MTSNVDLNLGRGFFPRLKQDQENYPSKGLVGFIRQKRYYNYELRLVENSIVRESENKISIKVDLNQRYNFSYNTRLKLSSNLNSGCSFSGKLLTEGKKGCLNLSRSEFSELNTMIQSSYIFDSYSTNQNLVSHQFGRSEAITLYG